MATAITCVATGPRIWAMTAVATRSSGGVLDRVERQHHQVDEVGSEVEKRDDADAERERERQVALRVADLAGGEGDVVPGVGREQRADHGDADQPDGCPAEIGAAPEVGEVGVDGLGAAAEEDAEADQAGEGADLGDGEDVLHDGARAQAARVDPGEEDDDRRWRPASAC